MGKTPAVKVAVVGLYRSGSSALAGLLHHLGVDMGAPFWGDYFEPHDLAAQLRQWWNEPFLTRNIADPDAENYLRDWLASRPGDGVGVGAKHPLLSLMAEPLVRAWGSDTKLLWSARDFEHSCRSLERLGWWPDSRRVQSVLWDSLQQLVRQREVLQVNHADVLADPRHQIRRIADYLQLDCLVDRLDEAASTIRTRKPAGQLAIVQPERAASLQRSQSQETSPGKVVATTLCGNNERMIAGAVESVIDWIDELILIDTGITDQSIARAREAAGDKLIVFPFQWSDDFSAARNAAIRFAEQRDAQWCVTVDTDERLVFPASYSREDWIESINGDPNVTAWLVTDQRMGYSKERIFRLPCQDQWRGRTHEAFVMASTTRRRRHPWLTFWELPKDAADWTHKLERDLRILREVTAEDPGNARWWFYLGQTLEGLKEFAKARKVLDRAFQLESWGEQAAWSAYCAARCSFALDDYEDTIERCCVGLAVQPQSPELLWLAGLSAYRLHRVNDAICWCEFAAHLGNHVPLIDFRIAFKYLPAWYEGPYDVLRFAYRDRGNRVAADAAERRYQQRRDERLQRTGMKAVAESRLQMDVGAG